MTLHIYLLFAGLGLFMFCLFVCLFLLSYCRVHCVNLAIWLLYVNKLTYLSPVQTGNKVEFNTVDFVEPATNRQQSWTFNFAAGLFCDNLNIYESRNDLVTLGVLYLFIYLCLSFFLSFFLSYLGDTRSLRMPALRPASQAGPMRNPREGTSVMLRDTIRLTWWCV